MFIPVKRETTCNRCGQPIAFRRNRKGKWYTSNVYALDGELVTRSRGWHTCPVPQPETGTTAPQIDAARLREFRRRVLEVCGTGLTTDKVQEILSAEFPEFAQ